MRLGRVSAHWAGDHRSGRVGLLLRAGVRAAVVARLSGMSRRGVVGVVVRLVGVLRRGVVFALLGVMHVMGRAVRKLGRGAVLAQVG